MSRKFPPCRGFLLTAELFKGLGSLLKILIPKLCTEKTRKSAQPPGDFHFPVDVALVATAQTHY